MSDPFPNAGLAIDIKQRDFAAKTVKAIFEEKFGFVVDNEHLVETAIHVADFLHDSFSYSVVVGGELAFEVKAKPAVSFAAWRDGETVVTAGGEDGFNERFQTLVDQINDVATDLHTTLAHLKTLRAEVATALSEVENELNALHRRMNSKRPRIVDPGIIGTFEPPIMVEPPRIFPIPEVIPDLTKYRELFGEQFANQISNATIDTIWRPTSDPDVGVLRGRPVKRVDVTELNGKKMEVWQSGSELILRPLAAGVQVDMKPFAVPKGVGEVGEFRHLLEEMNEEVTNEIANGGGQLQIKTFIEKFGGRKLKGGKSVVEFLDGVDESQTIANPESMIDVSAELVQKRLADSGAADAIIAGSVGFMTNRDVGEAKTEALKFIPSTHREAVAAEAGDLRTLAGMNVDVLAEQIDRASAINYINTAKILIGLGRR
jgi:hypothetical protein